MMKVMYTVHTDVLKYHFTISFTQTYTHVFNNIVNNIKRNTVNSNIWHDLMKHTNTSADTVV